MICSHCIVHEPVHAAQRHQGLQVAPPKVTAGLCSNLNVRACNRALRHVCDG